MFSLRVLLFIPRVLYRAVKYTLFFLLYFSLFLLLCFALTIPYAYERSSVCVEFPNGLLLGWASFVNPERIAWTLTSSILSLDWQVDHFSEHLAFKLPDGTVLIKGDAENVDFSASTVYGYALPYSRHLSSGRSQESYGFAYRPDTGFVLRRDDPELFEKLVEEAGELIVHPQILIDHPILRTVPKGNGIYIHIGGTFPALARDPEYRRESCPLDILPQRLGFFPQSEVYDFIEILWFLEILAYYLVLSLLAWADS